MQDLEISTIKNEEEVIKILEELVGADKTIRFNAKYSGVVKGKTFRFTDFSVPITPFSPVFKGTVKQVKEKTLIPGTFTTPWLGYFSIATFFLILLNFNYSKDMYVYIAGLGAMFLFILSSFRKKIKQKMLNEIHQAFQERKPL